jgi:hypothetical protein
VYMTSTSKISEVISGNIVQHFIVNSCMKRTQLMVCSMLFSVDVRNHVKLYLHWDSAFE